MGKTQERSLLRAAFLVGAILLMTARGVDAQQRGQPEGFWFGLALGTGWTHISCETCRADRGLGVSGNVRAGAAVSRRLLVGAEVNGWIKSADTVDELLGAFSTLAYWYPNARSGLQLKGGLGVLVYRASDAEQTFKATSFGPQLGVGYEFRIAGAVTLAPYLHILITPASADITSEGERVHGGVSLSMLQTGLALTWH